MEINLPGGDGLPKMPNFKPGPWIVPFALLALAVSSVGTMFYQVGPKEIGVVQRFGEYVRKTSPGLRMKLPFGIEKVTNVKVTFDFREEFGFRTTTPGIRTVYSGSNFFQSKGAGGRSQGDGDPFLEESMMLSGDLNVAIVEWIVQYKIKDPVAYLFNVRDQERTIRNMSEAVMRLAVGDHTINEVLTSGREMVQIEAKEKLQGILDSYEAGIMVEKVILQDVTPPDPVKPSFNSVNEARQEKEQLINQAWKEYNHVIPKAKGQAEQQIRNAEGYSLERINNAQGDAERFLLTLAEYKKAPKVTKQRLYLEMMSDVMPGLQDKMVIDESQKGILPLLNLNQEKGGAKS